jgi:hypothetical protein
MTQADNAPALRRSLDSDPTPGQRQAVITAKTPLPTGWGSFCSRPDSEHPSHWYATAPWNVFSLKEKFGTQAEYLAQGVVAETWAELHAAVQAQVQLYEEVTASSPEE